MPKAIVADVPLLRNNFNDVRIQLANQCDKPIGWVEIARCQTETLTGSADEIPVVATFPFLAFHANDFLNGNREIDFRATDRTGTAQLVVIETADKISGGTPVSDDVVQAQPAAGDKRTEKHGRQYW